MNAAPKRPVPVFPLPGVVLFPHAVLPLHVFELRYRTMVRDTLSGERMIAMAVLKPGWEPEYEASPEFYPIGCLARFEEVEWLTNDCYDLKVLGLSRVRFDRVVREYPYRSVRVSLLPQEPYSEDDPLIQIEKRALLETLERWRAAVVGGSFEGTLSDEIPYEGLVNAMCMLAGDGPLEKLELLGLDSVVERGRRIRELASARVPAAEPPPPPQPGGEQN